MNVLRKPLVFQYASTYSLGFWITLITRDTRYPYFYLNLPDISIKYYRVHYKAFCARDGMKIVFFPYFLLENCMLRAFLDVSCTR